MAVLCDIDVGEDLVLRNDEVGEGFETFRGVLKIRVAHLVLLAPGGVMEGMFGNRPLCRCDSPRCLPHPAGHQHGEPTFGRSDTLQLVWVTGIGSGLGAAAQKQTDRAEGDDRSSHPN
jgi:hypothetical protein